MSERAIDDTTEKVRVHDYEVLVRMTHGLFEARFSLLLGCGFSVLKVLTLSSQSLHSPSPSAPSTRLILFPQNVQGNNRSMIGMEDGTVC